VNNPGSLANDVARRFNTKAGSCGKGSEKGSKLEFSYEGKGFQIRVMNKNSGKRIEPYFRITKGRIGTNKWKSLNREGKYSDIKADTHFDITDDALKQIVDIIKRFIENGGK
jgi:hypothetical protein